MTASVVVSSRTTCSSVRNTLHAMPSVFRIAFSSANGSVLCSPERRKKSWGTKV
ncbi:MAG: hypothetical protein ACFFBZ_16210 [Promethearchaeota archaeon]